MTPKSGRIDVKYANCSYHARIGLGNWTHDPTLLIKLSGWKQSCCEAGRHLQSLLVLLQLPSSFLARFFQLVSLLLPFDHQSFCTSCPALLIGGCACCALNMLWVRCAC